MFNVSKKTILSGAVGNMLEIYDYAVWELLAVFLTREFLPPNSNLSDVFFIFLTTYLFRPVGGVILCLLADQAGRKRVLTISVITMGLCTAMVAILPGYQGIGISATILLLFIRLVQVFSLGGEYISSISLLIESCDKARRGYYGSWAAFGVSVGIMVASIVVTLITYLIEKSIIPDWGWRFAFVISLLTAILGFWIRSSIPESYEFITNNARCEKRNISDIFRSAIFSLKSRRIESMMVFFLVWFGVSITSIFYLFAPIYMANMNDISSSYAFGINTLSLLIVIIFIPFFGGLSDNHGRVKVLSFGIGSILLIIIPYLITIYSGTLFQVTLAHLLIAFPCACVFSITPVLITEIFPIEIRCTLTGIIYSVASCLGGGLTPIIAFRLAKNEHGPYLLGLFLLLTGYFCFLGLILLISKQKNNSRLKFLSELVR
jgi:MHS family proline/betaine transporter-like MFS transporter